MTSDVDPETAFSAAERAFIAAVVDRANTAVLEDDLPARRAATILRAAADCVEREGADPPTVFHRCRDVMDNPGSYLPTDVDGGGW
jgi:hypothetical protein